MKSIILAGVARSGKTTLARRLQKETGFSLLSGDALVSSFGGIFPQLGIQPEQSTETTAENLQEFLRIYLDQVSTWQNIPFILDIFHLMPEYVVEKKLHEKYQVLFFGYPEISIEQKPSDIRSHKTDHHDWTDEKSDEVLLTIVPKFIARSQKIKNSCERLGLTFIDTSRDFKKTLENAYQKIIAERVNGMNAGC